MVNLREIITSSESTGKSSLAYILLMTNVIGLSIFLEKNLGVYSKTRQNPIISENNAQGEKQDLTPPEGAHIPAPGEIKEEQKKSSDHIDKKHGDDMIGGNIKDYFADGIDDEVNRVLEEKFSSGKSPEKGEDKRFTNDYVREKIIDFKEAVKEMKIKESLKESKEAIVETNEPLKTLVWHFPKAVFKK